MTTHWGGCPPAPLPQTSVRYRPIRRAQPFDNSSYTCCHRKNSAYGNDGGAGSQSFIEKWEDNIERHGASLRPTSSGRYSASSASSIRNSNSRSSISATNSSRSGTTSSLTFTGYGGNGSSMIATRVFSRVWRTANRSIASPVDGIATEMEISPPDDKHTCIPLSFHLLAD